MKTKPIKEIFTSKKIKRYLGVSVLSIGIVLTTENCTKTDHVIGATTTTKTVPPPTASNSILNAVKITAALNPDVSAPGRCTWNGALDAAWNNAPKITINPTVPDVEGGNGFYGYIGHTTTMTMQALYDANNIYMLVEWDAAAPNMESSPWYFNSKTHLWAQGGAGVTYDVNGNMTMQSMVSDQFVALFNINNSCADFVTQSCYGACHQSIPVYAKDSNFTGSYTNTMHTNGANEKLDCWRARFYQVMNASQALDFYIDNDGGVATGSGIHADQTVPNGGNPPTYSSNTATNGTGGPSNKQSLSITGKVIPAKENVPIWINLADNYTNENLIPSDTLNCVFVVSVDSLGVLSYSNVRGGAVTGTLDPNANNTYKWVGTTIGNDNHSTWIPGKLVLPYTGGEGDVAANAYWTGTGWRLMLKRALKTGDVLNQDVDFSSLGDVAFGVGVMFQAAGSQNAADNQHAIVPGLTLHFQK